MNELDKAIEVFGCNLNESVLTCEHKSFSTYSIILLVEVVDVTVENLDKELH
jgi:hypothetical protein